VIEVKWVRVLILGGTGDSAALAAKVADLAPFEVVSSLAGRTQQPAVPLGTVRTGGFGGTAGLIQYLRAEHIQILIDATHPFAAQMSWHGAAAAAAVGIPFLMLVRPAWQRVEGDRWIEVATIEAAVPAIPATATRVFLTIGRQQLAPFAALTQTWFLMRSIDPPAADLDLPLGEILLDRGPFSLEQERHLLQSQRIQAIVSKNSGGPATYAKIIAARELGIPVVMVQRPAMPDGETVTDVDGAIAWLYAEYASLSIMQ
jgi:precorrin-6A/cobalt-precorrin-6A reductase